MQLRGEEQLVASVELQSLRAGQAGRFDCACEPGERVGWWAQPRGWLGACVSWVTVCDAPYACLKMAAAFSKCCRALCQSPAALKFDAVEYSASARAFLRSLPLTCSEKTNETPPLSLDECRVARRSAYTRPRAVRQTHLAPAHSPRGIGRVVRRRPAVDHNALHKQLRLLDDRVRPHRVRLVVQVARYLLSRGLYGIEGVVFLDERDRQMILLRAGLKVLEAAASERVSESTREYPEIGRD